MLDFVQIRTSTKKIGRKKDDHDILVTIYPEFIVGPTEDLLVKGGKFYAIWDEEVGMWSRDIMDVQRIIDGALRDKLESFPAIEPNIEVKWLREWSSNKWREFHQYVERCAESDVELDSKVIFSDGNPSKSDFSSRKLSYPMRAGSTDAYDELMDTLYDPIERQKIEWAIGSIFTGASKEIQKFIVLYGDAGSGKSTVLNIIQWLFEDYCSVFEARALTSKSNSFALESFSSNPLVSVDHDGDLSRIEDNTRLNSVVSHETMMVNEKYKMPYPARFNTFLFVGTNTPVKITNAKSGLMRRLIEVTPSGNHIPFDKYRSILAQIKFELSAIAYRCIQVYSDMGMDAYDSYRPTSMMSSTNDFYNFVDDSFDIFSSQDYVSLTQAWEMYKNYASDANIPYPMTKRVFKDELKNYFNQFEARSRINGEQVRNVYTGFRNDIFSAYGPMTPESIFETKPKDRRMLSLEFTVSNFDKRYSEACAQYANGDGTPMLKWDNVSTKLGDLDTSKLHYVKVPENHIVIDFDLVDENGDKSLHRNLKEAAKWPETYSELSKSGQGVHLHYIYDGDPSKLANSYSDRIEIKVFSGKASLRRKLTKCNNSPIKTISSGLPLKKGGDKVIDFEGLKNERALRTFIKKNLNKEYHPGTKPSIDFIAKGLEDSYSSGMRYDVSDMRQAISNFAAGSTHHAVYCMQVVQQMKFKSEEPSDGVDWDEDSIVFYDVEVFPNLFVVVYKVAGEDHSPVKMINPEPIDIEKLVGYKLVGFNNRRYDNHILYGRLMGYSNEQLYKLSSRIVSGDRNAMFAEAYGLSYTDIYDFSSVKQSLKKFEIELGIHHQELGLSWDEPVDESMWDKVASYCINDVVATEAVFNARQDDFHARQMLAELSGLSVNDTTNRHTTKIIFGNDRHPQDKFVYTDLSEMFPGYTFEYGKSVYREEEVGEGGYVYSEPGYYENVALLDVASMHPTSILRLNLFGDEYTAKFEELLRARLHIKHKEYAEASKMLGGRLAPYLGLEEDLSKLAFALKIVINSVYGLTAAKFDCEFKDPRNIDNIVAKRGALFMVDLKHAVQEKGYTVAHIKTDSIKIPNADEGIIKFVQEFGEKYGYTFEHEATYSKFVLVNDAVYVARDESGWSATGAQFAVPYIFKRMFSGEPLTFDDFCETKSVSGTSSIYLDMNESLADGEHDYTFVGRVGQFTPMVSGSGGGILLREKEGKYYAVTGTKGYRWLESEMVKTLEKKDDVDESYYEALMDKARDTIEKYVSYEKLVS